MGRRPNERLQADIVDSILKDLMAGASIKKTLEKFKVTAWAFYQTIDSDPILSREYARAQQVRAELLADEIVDIADDAVDAGKARNQIDVRKWYASKMQPAKYGDRIDLNVNQTVDIGAALVEARARAMLPDSYTTNVEEAQVVETVTLPLLEAPDSESVEHPNKNESDEIFS